MTNGLLELAGDYTWYQVHNPLRFGASHWLNIRLDLSFRWQLSVEIQLSRSSELSLSTKRLGKRLGAPPRGQKLLLFLLVMYDASFFLGPR